jgi:predicted PurR-regulated permease PerM
LQGLFAEAVMMLFFLLASFQCSASGQLIATMPNAEPTLQERLQTIDGLVEATEDLLVSTDGLMEAVVELLKSTLGEKQASYCTVLSIGSSFLYIIFIYYYFILYYLYYTEYQYIWCLSTLITGIKEWSVKILKLIQFVL